MYWPKNWFAPSKSSKVLIGLSLCFALLYSSISLVNHYCFRTYALDLGAYTNALYDYRQFHWNDSTVFKSQAENLLADHFDLYLILFSPLSYLFGSYTLLLVQMGSILLGGFGIYALFNLMQKNKKYSLLVVLYFYTFFAIFSALAFDYHSNIVAATILPWMFYFLKKEAYVRASIILLFIIVGKENMSFWMFFVLLGLSIEHYKNKKQRTFCFFAALFSLFAFLFITKIAMPAFSNHNQFLQFHYSFLGENYSQAIAYLFQHPLESLQALFVNHNNSTHGNFVKAEFHFTILCCGLPLLIKKPQYLIMLVPLYGQKLYHDDFVKWSIGFNQYCIEFAPILTIGIFSTILSLQNKKVRNWATILVLLFSMAVSIRMMNHTIIYNKMRNIQFFKKYHYQSNYKVSELHHQFNQIPQKAIVSCQSNFLPHLSLRNSIYQFPIIKDASYIIVAEFENPYPLSTEAFKEKVNELKQNPEWQLIYDGEILIFKK